MAFVVTKQYHQNLPTISLLSIGFTEPFICTLFEQSSRIYSIIEGYKLAHGGIRDRAFSSLASDKILYIIMFDNFSGQDQT